MSQIQPRLFNDKKYIFDLITNGLTQTVGDGGFRIRTGDLPLKKGAMVFHELLKAKAEVEVNLGVMGKNESVSPYFTDEHFQPTGTDRFGTFEANIELGLEGQGQGQIHGTPIIWGARGELNSSCSYALIKTVQSTDLRGKVMADIGKHVRFPSFINLKDVGAGEVHSLRAKMQTGVSAEVGAGFRWDYGHELFEDLFDDVMLKASAMATLSASLGFSLFESVDFSVGSLGVEPGWVRVRLARANSRKVTLGAAIDFQFQYDIGNGLVSLLEQILELEPVVEFKQSLDELIKIASVPADADWESVKSALSDRALKHLNRYLDIESFLEGNSFEQVISIAKDLVKTYHQIEPKMRNILERLLFKADLGPDSKIIESLKQIVALRGLPTNQLLETLTSEDFKATLELLEVLTGRSLEAFLVHMDSNLSDLINPVADAAAQALKFVAGIPPRVLESWQKIDSRLELKEKFDWLEKNATSVQKIQNSIDSEMKVLVERMVGKAFDKINSGDVMKIQTFASKVVNQLENAKQFDEKLKKKLKDMKGKLGFSAALEIERISASENIIDIELMVKNSKVNKAFKHLKNGNPRDFLKALPEGKENESGKLDALPYRLRSCMFFSEKIRSVATGVIFSGLLDLEKRVLHKRSQSQRVNLCHTNGIWTREAQYSGAFLNQVSIKNSSDWTSSVSWICQASGQGRDLDAAYDKKTNAMVLTSHRLDESSTHRELRASTLLLRNMGFSVTPSLEDFHSKNLPTSLALRVAIHEDAFSCLLRDWCDRKGNPTPDSRNHYLNTAAAWWLDELVHETIWGDKDAGKVLAFPVLQYFSPKFPIKNIHKGNFKRSFGINGPNGTQTFKPRSWSTILSAGVKLGTGLGGLSRIDTGSLTPKTIYEAMGDFATAARKCTPKGWPNPMFMIYLMMMKLRGTSGILPEHGIQGIATFRVKKDGNWEEMSTYRMGSD